MAYWAHGQKEANLAQQYFRSGEYEKASMLYKRLANQSGFNEYFYSQHIESLLAMEEYDEAKASVEKTLKKHSSQVPLYVTYGNLLERLAQPDEANRQYQIAINKIGDNRTLISNLGNAFIRLTKYDLALETFEKGEAALGNSGLFAYSVAEIYRRKNNKERMIHYYLQSPMASSKRMQSTQNYFDRFLDSDEDFEVLRKKLYEKVQEYPDEIFYPEMIQWVFIHSKKYARALRQARALDVRLEENGNRIFALAQIASNARDYDTAIKAYSYLLEHKDSNSSYYLDSKRNLLDVKRKKLIRNKNYAREDLLALHNEYETFLDDMGRGRRTALIILEKGELEALYLNDLDLAVTTLNDLLTMPGVNNYVSANAKLALGDYYLMQGDVWESTLLYSQVDKEFREDHLGEKARFKNAKLSYYIADFQWAQEQFNILKSATSKLISNDAIDLSVFIMDNANLDTTYAPLALYSESELLFFQNRSEEAFAKLDSIIIRYPDHGLRDDVYYAKARNLSKQKDYDGARLLYEQIYKEFPEDIRADNALFALAELHQNIFEQPEKAKDYYEKIFIDYSDSTFAIESRKRFRQLRGDSVQ